MQSAIDNRISKIPNRPEYYVYAHTKEDGTVFYVGKGKWERAWRSNNRETDWHKIAENEKWLVVILADCLTEEKALAYEKDIIEHFSKFSTLVNWHGNGDLRKRTHRNIWDAKFKHYVNQGIETCKV